jgi:hypothetical protein
MKGIKADIFNKIDRKTFKLLSTKHSSSFSFIYFHQKKKLAIRQ